MSICMKPFNSLNKNATLTSLDYNNLLRKMYLKPYVDINIKLYTRIIIIYSKAPLIM